MSRVDIIPIRCHGHDISEKTPSVLPPSPRSDGFTHTKSRIVIVTVYGAASVSRQFGAGAQSTREPLLSICF
jgi:hypothetical protein